MRRSIERHVDGEASSLQDSYYPMDIAQECESLTPRDIPKGTIRAMADHGYVEVGYVDEVTTRMPTPDAARKLGLGTGTPALVYVRTTHTTERPLRLTVTIFAGDRNRIVYELGDLHLTTVATDRSSPGRSWYDLSPVLAMRYEASAWLSELWRRPVAPALARTEMPWSNESAPASKLARPGWSATTGTTSPPPSPS